MSWIFYDRSKHYTCAAGVQSSSFSATVEHLVLQLNSEAGSEDSEPELPTGCSPLDLLIWLGFPRIAVPTEDFILLLLFRVL
jgi:hypothetical protein